MRWRFANVCLLALAAAPVMAVFAQEVIPSEPARPGAAHRLPATPGTSPATQGVAKIAPDLAQRVEQIVTQLDDENYKTREAASAALADMPAEAVPYLEDQLKRADLPPEARSRIELVIGPLRGRAKRYSRQQQILQWNQRNFADAYDQVGDRDPKWDTEVKAALSQAAAYFSIPSGQRNNVYVEPMMSLCDKAMQDGCKDPLVQFTYDRLHNLWIRQRDDRKPSDMMGAAQVMEKSKYCVCLKATADILAADDLHYSQNDPNYHAGYRNVARKFLSQARSHIAEAAGDASVPREQLIGLCEIYVQTMQSVETSSGPGVALRTKDFAALDKILAREHDENDPVRQMTAAFFDISRAEDEGGQWGEGEAAVNDWLGKAAEAAETAYKQDPKLPCASLMMIDLCRDRSRPVEEEEQWFSRAVDANPDGIEPYRAKLLYLQATQSDEQALQFARECFHTQRWAARIPIILAQTRLNNAPNAGWYWDNRPAQYWSDSDVWKDVTDAYSTCLKRYPDSWFDRSFYALLAYYAQHWDVADEQMKLAGDHVDYQLFGGKQDYELLRAEVAMRVKNPASQPSAKDLAAKHAAAMTAYNQRVLTDAYEKVGHHNGKWDGDARELLRQAVPMMSNSPNRTRGEEDVIFALSAKLDAEGCDDPLVKYIAAYVDDCNFREELTEAAAGRSPSGAVPSSKPSADAAYRTRSLPAAIELAASNYPASMRFKALAWGAWLAECYDTYDFGQRKSDVRHALKIAQTLFPQAMADKDWPLADQFDASSGLMATSYWDGDGRKSMYDALAAAMAKAWPADSPRLLCLEALYDEGLAEDIHKEAGNSPLGAFTGPKRAEYDKFLTSAEKLYEKAWLEDPTDPQPANRLILICDWEDRSTMCEKIWFHRAMLTDADDYNACENRMYFLDALHHGSEQLMHNFGHECCWSDNWAAGLPLILGIAQKEIGCERAGGKEDPTFGYYRFPQVWRDTMISYGTYLEKYPADTEARSTYAKLACIAHQWDAANEQFKILGDHPRLSVFGTRAKYEALRRQAASEAAKPKPKGEMIAPKDGG